MMELLVVIALAMLILAALHGFQRAQIFAMREQETRVAAQAATRATLDVMLREIRMAGYGGTCPNDILPVVEAEPDRMRMQIDWNGDGAIGSGEDIAYAFDEKTGEIQRTVAGGKGGDLTIPVIANVSSGKVFRYLDANGVETANVKDIRAVDVGVRVASASPYGDAVADLTSGLDAKVLLRNASAECAPPGKDDGDGGVDDGGDGKDGDKDKKDKKKKGKKGKKEKKDKKDKKDKKGKKGKKDKGKKEKKGKDDDDKGKKDKDDQDSEHDHDQGKGNDDKDDHDNGKGNDDKNDKDSGDHDKKDEDDGKDKKDKGK
jgi:hypothetical protein